jgi:hypothetical protein
MAFSLIEERGFFDAKKQQLLSQCRNFVTFPARYNGREINLPRESSVMPTFFRLMRKAILG